MKDLLIPALGILGTILGTLMGGMLAHRAERARAIREERARWEQVRLVAYSSFLQSTRAFMETSIDRIHLQLEKYQKSRGEYPAAIDEELEKLQGTRTRTKQALAEIELLAPPDVVDAAHALDKAVEDFDGAMFKITATVHVTLSRVDSGAEETEEEKVEREEANVELGDARKEEQRARAEFCAKAKLSLGI